MVERDAVNVDVAGSSPASLAISQILGRQLHDAQVINSSLDHFSITYVDALKFAEELAQLQLTQRTTVHEIYQSLLHGKVKFMNLPVRVIGYGNA